MKIYIIVTNKEAEPDPDERRYRVLPIEECPFVSSQCCKASIPSGIEEGQHGMFFANTMNDAEKFALANGAESDGWYSISEVDLATRKVTKLMESRLVSL